MRLFGTIARDISAIMQTWKQLRTNWMVATVNKFVLLLFLLSLVIIAWRWRLLPPAVPLWYSRPWGEDQLAHPAWLLLLPFGSLVWFIFTVGFTTTQTVEYPLFTRVLFLATLLVAFLSFVTLIKILFLIT